MKSTNEILSQRSRIDLSYAPTLLSMYDDATKGANPLLRFLNGESIEAIRAENSPDQLNQAYRQLALKHHPDRNPPKSSDEALMINRLFVLIADAYVRLSSGGQEELPLAIDLRIKYYGDGEGVPAEIYNSSFTSTFIASAWQPAWNPCYSSVYANRNSHATRNVHPDFNDIEMALVYGMRTFDQHEWESSYVASVEFRSIDRCLDKELAYWHPVNHSEKEIHNVSTSIRKGRDGGIFLIPTVLAPQYQESVSGRLDDIFEIYTDKPDENHALVLPPSDIVAMGDIEEDLSLVGLNEMLKPWAYIEESDLQRLVQEFHQRFLENQERKRLQN